MKWSILVECKANNLKDFDYIFFENDKWQIPMDNIKGIMIVDEEVKND